ncbi:hypothetical protein PROFUN_11355 [Planoprotostelium fungivorum]|uniref:FACT complex subunit SSRP1 n=1 Tax=Planoprotostelium fungivorum TaxID=1890364 RepID=A0A2P6NAD4_9EUKA|nr:hypothetical protein PROFUN_11355 [Planoprotostelium fungivorum]
MVQAEFPGILIESSNTSGVLKISSNGLTWKNKVTNFEVRPDNLKGASWVRVGRPFQLEVQLKRGITRFDGFKEQDFEAVESALKSELSIELKQVAVSTKGWNWGVAEFQGPNLLVNIDNKRGFQIPLMQVSRCATSNQPGTKSDISLEFHTYDTLPDEQSLIEMRFHVPSTSEEGEPQSTVFHDKVVAEADIDAESGKGIFNFKQIHLLTPRGRYDLELFLQMAKLRGKSYDYKIQYNHVARCLQLPKPDEKHILMVLTLDPPIKQGQTRYPHLVLQFEKDEIIDMESAMGEGNNEKLKEVMGTLGNVKKGPTYSIIGQIITAFSGRKIITPGSFRSAGGATAVKCTVKANDGLLYPLERAFMFVHKPPIYVRHEEIANVEFSRVSNSAANKTFDLIFTLTSSTTHTFSGILQGEYDLLFAFVVAKKIKIKMSEGRVVELKSKQLEQEVDDDDESSAEDEDFIAGDEDEDVPEEFDAEYEHPLDGQEKEKKRKKEKKEKREKKEKKDKKSKKSKE